MSVNTKLTNLANEIREISGTTTKKSLDVMASDVSAANDLIDEQETLLNDLRDIVDTLPEPIGGVEYHPDDDGLDGLSIDRSFSYIDIKQENEIYTYADCSILPSGNLRLNEADETTNLEINSSFNNIEFNAENRISLRGYTTVFASGDVDSQLELTRFNGQVDAPNLTAGNIKSGVNILGVTGTLKSPQWDYGSSTLENNYGYTTYEVPYGVGYFYIDCSEYYATDLENVLLRINNSTIIDLSDYAPYNDITLYVYRGVIIIKNYTSNLFIHDEGAEIYSIELQPVSQGSVSIDVDYEALR